MSKFLCSVDGCDQEVVYKKLRLCPKHYARFRKYGDVTARHLNHLRKRRIPKPGVVQGRPRIHPIGPKQPPVAIERICLKCDILFVATLASQVYCSSRCRKNVRLADKWHRRRARKQGSQIEHFNAKDIFNRDGWTCQGCHLPVRQDRRAGLPDSPELDHIVPLSRGGGHIRTNVQLLCRKCNGTKHAKIPADVRLGALATYKEAKRNFNRYGGPSCWAVL